MHAAVLAAGLAAAAVQAHAEVMPLTMNDFTAGAVGSTGVWVVGFGFNADCPEMQKAAALQEELEWLEVGWVDVGAGAEARALADIHGASAFPHLVVLNPQSMIPLLKGVGELTVKNAIEKWLPPMMWEPRRRGLVHTLPERDAVKPVAADEAQEFCTLYAKDIQDTRAIAGLRAVALRYANVVKHRFVVKEDAARGADSQWVECTGLAPAVPGETTPEYSELVAYFDDLVDAEAAAAHVYSEEEEATRLEAGRASADERAYDVLMPKLNSYAKWSHLQQTNPGGKTGFYFVFALDSTSKKFEQHYATALAVAKTGGGKVGKKMPVSFAWVDTSAESPKVLKHFTKNEAPALSFVVPITTNGAEGENTGRGVNMAQKFHKDFTQEAVMKYIDGKLVTDQRIQTFADEETLEAQVWSTDDEPLAALAPEGKAINLKYKGDEVNTPADAGKKADKKAKDKKKKEAEKKKKGKKKEEKKVTKKEQEKLDKIKAEQEAKQKAREERIRAKKEKEQKEKEDKERKKAEKKAKKKEKKGDGDDAAVPKKSKKEKEAEKRKKEAEKKKKEKEEKKKKDAEKKAKKKEEEKKAKEERAKRSEEDKKKREEEKKKREEERIAKMAEKVRKEADEKARKRKEKEEAAAAAETEPEAAADAAADEPAAAEDAAAAAAAEEEEEEEEAEEKPAEKKKKKAKKAKEEDPEKEAERKEKEEKRRKEREEKKKQEKEYRDMMRKMEKERKEREKKEKAEAKRRVDEAKAEANREQRAREKEWAEEDGEDIVIDEL